jgi:hypothetical protein
MPLPKWLQDQVVKDKRGHWLRAKFPHFDEAEIRLRHRWGPDKVIAWYKSRFPGQPAPNRKTLFRYLADKPESWFIGALDAMEIVTPKVPRLLVLERQAAMIETMEARIGRALVKERAIQEADPKPYLNEEIRENMALLARMYHDHFQTLQESGIEPKAAQKLKVKETGRVFHDVFHFLRPEEALNLKKLQADVDSGVIDLKEFYD